MFQNNDDLEKEDVLRNKIDMERLPSHIAIITDGNGRWAKKKFLPRAAGHKAGVERVKEVVKAVGDLGIGHLTFYTFSTENWNRPKDEIDSLMKLLVKYLDKELNTLHENDVKITVLGDLTGLPSLPKEKVIKAIEKTKNNNTLNLNIALNYGGRNEIIRATKKIIEDVEENRISIDDIDEETFKNYLYTGKQPDPDLLIRTSGELRISNFLLYQIAYTEFSFPNIYWPDFSKKYLYKTIIDYQNRNRRFGGI